MAEYCENCGAKLGNDSRFCQECGHNVEEICPNCGNTTADSENFCENCGTNLNTPQQVTNTDYLEKYRLPIIISIIAAIAILSFVTVPMIMDYSAGSQIVNVDGYDFKIPANFNESASGKIVKSDGPGSSKRWVNGDEYIEIWVLTPQPGKSDADFILNSVGGSKQNKYGHTGFHNIFENGDEAFSFNQDNKAISIFVSDSKLFDKIEVI